MCVMDSILLSRREKLNSLVEARSQKQDDCETETNWIPMVEARRLDSLIKENENSLVKERSKVLWLRQEAGFPGRSLREEQDAPG